MLEEVLSLGEGNTPLVKAIRIPFYTISDLKLFFKDESRNPTRSFADRGVYKILKKYADGGIEGVITYSTGDIGTSIAAYASRLGINTYVLVSEEEFDPKKYSEIINFDVKVIVIKASKEKVYEMIKVISGEYPYKKIIMEQEKEFVESLDDIINEIKEEMNVVDYLFIGLEDKEEPDYSYFKKHFEKRGILCAGVTNSKELAQEEDLIFVEKFEIEEARMMMAKNEGLSRDHRAAIALAGILKWDRLNGFEKGDNVIHFIDKKITEKEDAVKEVENIIEVIEADIDKLKEIMRLY